MPRPTRSWVRKTYTVSPLVEKAIAMRAAVEGIDPGTVIDILVWNALVKPDEARLKRDDCTEEELERIFAEDALALLDGKEAMAALADHIPLDGANNSRRGTPKHHQQVEKLVGQWRKTRVIEKRFWNAIIASLAGFGFNPSANILGMVISEAPLPGSLLAEPALTKEEEFERSFADEALEFLKTDEEIDALADEIEIDEESGIGNLLAVERMVKRWRKERTIDKQYQRALLSILDGGRWIPSILREGLIDQEWFE